MKIHALDKLKFHKFQNGGIFGPMWRGNSCWWIEDPLSLHHLNCFPARPYGWTVTQIGATATLNHRRRSTELLLLFPGLLLLVFWTLPWPLPCWWVYPVMVLLSASLSMTFVSGRGALLFFLNILSCRNQSWWFESLMLNRSIGKREPLISMRVSSCTNLFILSMKMSHLVEVYNIVGTM